MFGLYRRCGSSKYTISVNGRNNGSNLNTFTNSSNISTIQSSILYNSTNRSANGKIMNVLLLLFLVFGSCVVSFGMKKNNNQVDIAPRDRYLSVPTRINTISMFFLTKVMSVKKNDIKDEVDKGKNWVYLFSLLGLNENDLKYTTKIHNKLGIVFFYSISTILLHSFYRGIFSVKSCLNIIKEGGNCELYFGVGNVPYVGGLFNFSLVCKPTFILQYLPNFLKNKVTIHLIDLKPFNYIYVLSG